MQRLINLLFLPLSVISFWIGYLVHSPKEKPPIVQVVYLHSSSNLSYRNSMSLVESTMLKLLTLYWNSHPRDRKYLLENIKAYADNDFSIGLNEKIYWGEMLNEGEK